MSLYRGRLSVCSELNLAISDDLYSVGRDLHELVEIRVVGAVLEIQRVDGALVVDVLAGELLPLGADPRMKTAVVFLQEDRGASCCCESTAGSVRA